MKPLMTTIVILSCIVALKGCRDPSNSTKGIPKTEPNVPEAKMAKANDPPSSEIPRNPPADTFEIIGTIAYKSFEGGFFAIDGDNGRKYNPINLPESFRKDGLKVKVSARKKTDAMSIHMYGAIVDIVEIAAK